MAPLGPWGAWGARSSPPPGVTLGNPDVNIFLPRSSVKLPPRPPPRPSPVRALPRRPSGHSCPSRHGRASRLPICSVSGAQAWRGEVGSAPQKQPGPACAPGPPAGTLTSADSRFHRLSQPCAPHPLHPAKLGHCAPALLTWCANITARWLFLLRRGRFRGTGRTHAV